VQLGISDHFDRSDWWDRDGMLLGLHTLLDPVRVPRFRARLESGSRVLDVGSGGGFVTRALIEAGHDAVALDLSLRAIGAAHGVGIPQAVVARGEQLPFAEDRFDAIVCSEVLEHVNDPAAVVAEAARVLRPGGRFLFSGPNRTLRSRLLLIDVAQRWTRVLPHDLHSWDRFIRPHELAVMLRNHGLRIDDLTGVSIPPRSWPRAARALLALARGRIGFAEAGERIDLRLGGTRAIAFIGSATLGAG